jgi:hypothetical protein
MPVLGERKKDRPAGDKPLAPPKAPAPKPAAIKLAPLPTVTQPAAEAEPPEQAAQKPDLRLPIDAIKAASRSGTKPLIDHVRKTQGKRRETHEETEPVRPAARPSFPRERPVRSKEMIGGDVAPPVQRSRACRSAANSASSTAGE